MYQCNICGFKGRFQAYNGREAARCPKCQSLERHRLIWRFIKQYTPIGQGQPCHVLHIAPENCLARRIRKMEHVVYLTGDRNPKRESTDRKLDLTELSLESNQFDVLLCNHVLEHIHDDAAAIREIYRVCKPGGQAVITVPTRPGITDYDPTVRNPDERKKRFGQADHVRYYGRDSLPITLGVPGFVVDVVDMHIVMSDEERARHSTRGERQIYWCRKGL